MPSWTLPEPMFQPMWNASYLTMGYASYMVWKCGGGFHGKAQLPLLLYGGQLALSLAWIPLCYGAKSIKLATITSVGTEVLAIAATVTFYSVCPKAAYLMIPYLAWLTYETSLSLALVCLNKDKNQE